MTSSFTSSFSAKTSCCLNWAILLSIYFLLSVNLSHASEQQALDPLPSIEKAQLSDRVEVNNVSSDSAIDQRLSDILKATGWFSEVEVTVRKGVVFLDGVGNSAEHRDWAVALANKTTDVVAVVNRIRLVERPIWDLSGAMTEFKTLLDLTPQKLPRLGLGLFILLVVGIFSKLLATLVRKALSDRLQPLLCDVAAKILSILVFLIGFYLVLLIAGLSGLAATVLGGTGLIGLVAGIAFRDILENFLASILISLQNPFHLGDQIEIAGHTGMVLRVTTRGTVLMNLDGNHVQIPNATVYKSIIRNYTANPNRRMNFEVGIGFDTETSLAQQIAMQLLERHPAVLKDPEAVVLVDKLGSATVTLAIFFWYDGSAYDGYKVRSSLMRQVKHAYEDQGISMPDEAREILFPEGVPVRMLDKEHAERATVVKPSQRANSAVEDDLGSEDEQLREQARRARVPEEGASLIEE